MMEDLGKSVKVNCDFCDKQIECPESMLENSKKHMCYECFITFEPSEHELTDVHVDIPTNKLAETIASKAADSMVEEIFPGLWNDKKEGLKEMSKRDLATEMFGVGVYLGIKTFMENMKRNDEKDSADNQDSTLNKNKNDDKHNMKKT